MDTSPITAEAFIAAGASPADAASLAAQHNILAGRGTFDQRVELSNELKSRSPAPSAAPESRTSNGQLADATVQHQDVQLAGQLDATFAPPAQAYDYRAPPPVENATDEQFAADSALKTVLHTEATPAFIGNAIMSDLAANKLVEHDMKPEERTAVLGQLSRMLEQARAAPALRPYISGATPEGLLSILSRQTVISLLPWVQYRAGKAR